MGLPTETAGSHQFNNTLKCTNTQCHQREHQWYLQFLEGYDWDHMLEAERASCEVCTAERERRNRLVETNDPRVREEPFVGAPYIHKNNEPKYHALLLRAEEFAKRQKRFRLWFAAQDLSLIHISEPTRPY